MSVRGVLVVACLLTSVGWAHAQDDDDAEARALFDAGRHAFDDGRFVEALDLFRRSYERSGLPSLWYNIGVAADRASREAEALEAYERFVAGSPDNPRVRMVRGRIEVLQARLEPEASEETDTEEEVEVDPVTEPTPAERPNRIASSILIAAAAGATAAAVGVWVRANKRFDRWRDRCPSECSNAAADSIDRRVAWTRGLTVSAIVLGAAAVSALIVESVRVHASVGPEGASVGASLAF